MSEFNTKRNGIEVKIVETGEVFNSIQACADRLRANVTWLGHVIRGERGNCTVHGYHIVRTDGTYNKVDICKKEHRGRPGVKVMIVETGEKFDSLTDCAKAIKGSPSKIRDVLYGRRRSHRDHTFIFIK